MATQTKTIMKNKLAILGGKPTLTTLNTYKSISKLEIKEVNKVLKSGKISCFYGSWEEGFLGGEKIQELEALWSKKFEVKYSVSVNSNTSGLYAAIGAIGISPGDEILVPSTSMSATAMAPLIYGAIPIFVDIDKDTFCMNIDDVKKKITKKTKAILTVNLFGHPAKLKELKNLTKKKNLFLIEDNAQGPLATEDGRYAGTIGDIGIFSLNYHKHIHSGEGGICVTNDKNLAERMQMIRNHAEAVVGPSNTKDLTNMVGFNFRMTEISAAIAIQQLKHIDQHVNRRVDLAENLSTNLNNLPGIEVPKVRKNCKHVYYVWAIKYDKNKLGISRKRFVNALNHQGFPCSEAYLSPLYNLPVFKNKIAFGRKGYPFNLSKKKLYKDRCDVAEDLHKEKFICFEPCAYEINEKKCKLLVEAFKKVYDNIHQLDEV